VAYAFVSAAFALVMMPVLLLSLRTTQLVPQSITDDVC